MKRGKPQHSPRRGGHSSRSGGRPQQNPRREQRGLKPSAIPQGRWCIGLHAVRELFKVRPGAVAEVWLKQGWESSEDLRQIADLAKGKMSQRPEGLLDRLGSGHQGVAARATQGPEFSWEHVEAPGRHLVLLCDGIQDPHNLGAILRTAWLIGAKGVFIPEHRASPLTPSAIKVASGGAEHVPVLVDGNLTDSSKRLKELGFWIYGLSHEARSTLWQVKFPEKVAIVIGNEENGIRSPLERQCDELIRIPQVAPEASFNASVAAAVVQSEVLRQWSQ